MHVPRFLLAAVMLAAFSTTSHGAILWVGDSSGVLGTVDTTTGNVSVIGDMGVVMTDIAFDPTGALFGISFNELYSIDTSTAVPALIGSTGITSNSLVFDSSGTLYTANTALYSLDTMTGAASLIGGGGGYNSSGDLAFVGGDLYLSSSPGDDLFIIDPATGAGTNVGGIGFSSVFGLATDDNINLFGTAGTNVLSIDPATGAGSVLVDYSGQGLGNAFGSAFVTEAAPTPATLALLGAGLAVLASRRRKDGHRSA